MRAAGFSGLLIDGNFPNRRIGAQSQIACVHRGINQASRRIERGVNVATALTFACAAAVASAAIFVVLQTLAGNTSAILREHAAHLLNALLQGQLGAV